MKKSPGFTLIEVLIALAIFAIVASITTSSLYYAFNTRTRVTEQTDRLAALQLGISLIQQDSLQATARAVRGNDMQLFPAFIGRQQYLEFTRDGLMNLNSQEKQSTLQRVALLCKNNRLIRRTWATLDPVRREITQDKVLVDKLQACHFNYLNHDLQTLPVWREQAVTPNQVKEPLPKAFQVSLQLSDWGQMQLLFLLPGAAYESTP